MLRILEEQITINELIKIAKDTFGNMVKAVVDIEKGIMAIGGELHSDEEMTLIENGSEQKDLWGINLYPEIKDETWIEFDSMINLRPSRKNITRGIEDPEIRNKIIKIVNNLIKK